MKTGVVYLLTHMQLAARLVVSVNSLRRWYAGPVTIFTSRPESHDIGRLMAADDRLRVDHRIVDEAPSDNAYLSAYLTKATFLSESPYEATILLDADTLVVGAFDELVSRSNSDRIVATIYGPYTTTDSILEPAWRVFRSAVVPHKQRIRWLEFLARATSNSYPLINTGVLALQRNPALLREWRELSNLGREAQTPEELAMQLLLMGHPHRLLGAHFNCLPQLNPSIKDVRIWHFAGAAHLSHPTCRSIWLPEYQECLRLDVAGLSRWSRIERLDNADPVEL